MTTRPAHYNTKYKFDLSPRQREVLDLIARGQTNAEIANALGVTLDGAKYHVREILAKLNVDSREEAAAYWRDYNRPLAKLGRAFSGVLGLGTLKAVVGAAGIVAAGAAIAVVVIGINANRGGDESGVPSGADDETPIVTPTPEPPSTPPASPTVETPEAFAARVAGLVEAGEVGEIMAFADPDTFVCPGPTPQGAGGPFPLCEGAGEGEIREGYIVSPFASEATTIDEAAFAAQLEAALPSALAPTTLGRVDGQNALLVAFDRGEFPQALYLVFDAPDGETPRLRAFGTSDEPALITGGEAVTVAGPAVFEPLD